MLIKLFINHLGFVTNDYEQGYYSLNRNGFFIEIVIQVKIRSTSLCVKKKLHAIYFSLFSNKLLPRVNYFSLIGFDWNLKNTAACGKSADVAMFTAS